MASTVILNITWLEHNGAEVVKYNGRPDDFMPRLEVLLTVHGRRQETALGVE